MGKTYLAFHQFMIIIDMAHILKRNVNVSILTFQSNVLYWKTVLCPVHVLNILITFQIPLFFQKKIYIYTYKIIKNLDPNKADGHDMISIRMIKLCGISIYKPLEIFFQNCLRLGKFPSEWKMLFLHLKRMTNSA